jgi:hypothetical protein
MEAHAASGTSGAPAQRDLAALVGWSLLGVVLWLAHVQLPIEPAAPELDPSWQQALSRALVLGIDFGRDLVFTFGPLGGPQHARYEPDLFWTQIIFYECLFKGLLTWRWIALLRRSSGTLNRTVFALVNLYLPGAGDSYMLASTLVIGTGLLRPGRRGSLELLLDFSLLAALGYVKFTYLAFGAGITGLVVCQALTQSRREALRVALWSVGSAFLTWMLCGQSPIDLPFYVWRSASLARGYSEANAVDGPDEDLHWAFASLVVLALLIAVHVLATRPRRAALFTAACAAGGAFVAFRSSFTYHADVAVTFFGFTLALPMALAVPVDAARGFHVASGALRAVSLVLALAGVTRGFHGWVTPDTITRSIETVERNLRDFTQLPARRAHLDSMRLQIGAQYALPRIRALIGSHDVDFLGDMQAWVFLNDLRWNPRPVLQSYAATSVELAELDAAFYRSARAPRFVMYQTGAVFARLEGTDDGPACREVLRGYRPVAIERGVLLFERVAPGTALPEANVRRIAALEAGDSEPVRLLDLPGKLTIVRFDVEYSLLGKLRSMFLHAPITKIEVTGTDHAPRRRRLVPGMAQAGVVMRPLIEFPEDWIDQYSRGVDKVALGFRIGSPNGWEPWYAPKYRVVVESLEDELPRLSPEQRTRLVFGSFPTPPVSETSSYHSRYFFEGGREFVLVGDTTTLTFAPAVGSHQLVGAYGLLEGIIPLTDGLDFEVRVVPESGEPKVVFTRTLDKNAADAKRAEFDVRFDIQPGDRLEVRTGNPPERNREYDIPYFERIEIRSLP